MLQGLINCKRTNESFLALLLNAEKYVRRRDISPQVNLRVIHHQGLQGNCNHKCWGKFFCKSFTRCLNLSFSKLAAWQGHEWEPQYLPIGSIHTPKLSTLRFWSRFWVEHESHILTSVWTMSAKILAACLLSSITEAEKHGYLRNSSGQPKMSHVMRKLVFWLCNQLRHKPACSATGTS